MVMLLQTVEGQTSNDTSLLFLFCVGVVIVIVLGMVWGCAFEIGRRRRG